MSTSSATPDAFTGRAIFWCVWLWQFVFSMIAIARFSDLVMLAGLAVNAGLMVVAVIVYDDNRITVGLVAAARDTTWLLMLFPTACFRTPRDGWPMADGWVPGVVPTLVQSAFGFSKA